MHTQQRQQRIFLAVVLAAFFACRFTADATLTPAGTGITNVANVVYTTAEGTFTGTSNTVTTITQNAPSLSVVSSGNQNNITPAMIVVDTFTLTNTGNNTAASNVFSLDAVAAFTGTGSPTLLGYTLTGSTCIVTAPCGTTTAENALAGMTGAGPITVGVVYQLASTATVGQTVTTTLHAEITYQIVASQVAATSSDTTGTETDTSVVDARLDVQTSVVSPGSVGANIVWTVKANNGGGNPALGLLSAKAALSSVPTLAGVVLFVPVPTFSSVPLVLQGAPTLTPGTLSPSAAATLYYNPAQCSTSPVSGWTVTYNSSAGCMAVYVSGGTGGQELPSATGGSSGAGTSLGTPQITLAFTTAPPGAAGGGVANSVSLISSSAVGGAVWTSTGLAPILGQGVTMGTADAATASLLNGIQANTTPSSLIVAPGGASNVTSSQAFSTYSILIGPLGNAAATGAWSAGTFGYTSGTASNLLDFTFIDSGPLSSTNLGTNAAILPVGASGLTVPGAVQIKGTVQNLGNITDTVNLTVSTVGTWVVTFQCLNGASVTCGGGSANTCYTTNITATTAILGQATFGICATFTPGGTVTGLAPLDWTITATSVGNSGVSNTTHDVLYPGGVLVSFRSAVVSACAGAPALAPGCTITYSVTLVNEAPNPTAGTGSGNISVSPTGSAVVSENGTSGDNWGTNSNGLTAIPTFVSCAACTTTGVATNTSFTVTIPAADLGPQQTVTYTYAVILK
jgi:hypothetical protein